MIHHGDCPEVMAGMEPESVDAVVTDPPYMLEFMGKSWDNPMTGHAEGLVNGRPGAKSRGIAGNYRRGELHAKMIESQAWHHRWAEAAYRVAKPSAYLLAFGGTRTVHRLTSAIEDAGWIIRDMLVWAYASGFPKSKASLKPAWEPIVMARKPGPLRMLAIDACRIGYASPEDYAATVSEQSGARSWKKVRTVTTSIDLEPAGEISANPAGRWPANVILTATEWYTLRDDVDQSARRLICDFFEAQGLGDDGLPGMRQVVRDHAGVGARRSAEVLLPSVQLEGFAGREAGGRETLAGVAPTDERAPDRQGDGAGVARLEGRTLARPERVRERGRLDADGAGAGTSGGDGSEVRERAPVHSGASASDGDDAGSTADNLRGGPSPQRDQGRQPAGQPVPQGSVEPHADAPDDRPRTRGAPGSRHRAGSGKRGVTVPLDLIPPGWRRYFRFSHDTGIFDGGWEGVVGGGESTGAWQEATRYGWRDRGDGDGVTLGLSGHKDAPDHYGDSGTYSRFFVLPKASRSDREPVLTPDWFEGTGRVSTHPTVKPVDLMRHLVRLVTPTGGTVLDPFLGSGTTGIAAEMEGFEWIGIEKEAEYVAIAEARLNGTQRGLGLPA